MSKTLAAQFVAALRNYSFVVSIGADHLNRYHYAPKDFYAAMDSIAGEKIGLDSGNAVEFADGSVACRDYDRARHEANWVVEG